MNSNIQNMLTVQSKPCQIISKEAFPFSQPSGIIIKLDQEVDIRNTNNNNNQLDQVVVKRILF